MLQPFGFKNRPNVDMATPEATTSARIQGDPSENSSQVNNSQNNLTTLPEELVHAILDKLRAMDRYAINSLRGTNKRLQNIVEQSPWSGDIWRSFNKGRGLLQSLHMPPSVTVQPTDDQSLYKALKGLGPSNDTHFNFKGKAALSFKEGNYTITQGEGKWSIDKTTDKAAFNACCERLPPSSEELHQGQTIRAIGFNGFSNLSKKEVRDVFDRLLSLRKHRGAAISGFQQNNFKDISDSDFRVLVDSVANLDPTSGTQVIKNLLTVESPATNQNSDVHLNENNINQLFELVTTKNEITVPFSDPTFNEMPQFQDLCKNRIGDFLKFERNPKNPSEAFIRDASGKQIKYLVFDISQNSSNSLGRLVRERLQYEEGHRADSWAAISKRGLEFLKPENRKTIVAELPSLEVHGKIALLKGICGGRVDCLDSNDKDSLIDTVSVMTDNDYRFLGSLALCDAIEHFTDTQQQKVLGIIRTLPEDSATVLYCRLGEKGLGRLDVSGVEQVLRDIEDPTHFTLDSNISSVIASFGRGGFKGLFTEHLDRIFNITNKLPEMHFVNAYKGICDGAASSLDKAKIMELADTDNPAPDPGQKKLSPKSYATLIGPLCKVGIRYFQQSNDSESSEKLINKALSGDVLRELSDKDFDNIFPKIVKGIIEGGGQEINNFHKVIKATLRASGQRRLNAIIEICEGGLKKIPVPLRERFVSGVLDSTMDKEDRSCALTSLAKSRDVPEELMDRLFTETSNPPIYAFATTKGIFEGGIKRFNPEQQKILVARMGLFPSAERHQLQSILQETLSIEDMRRLKISPFSPPPGYEVDKAQDVLGVIAEPERDAPTPQPSSSPKTLPGIIPVAALPPVNPSFPEHESSRELPTSTALIKWVPPPQQALFATAPVDVDVDVEESAPKIPVSLPSNTPLPEPDPLADWRMARDELGSLNNKLSAWNNGLRSLYPGKQRSVPPPTDQENSPSQSNTIPGPYARGWKALQDLRDLTHDPNRPLGEPGTNPLRDEVLTMDRGYYYNPVSNSKRPITAPGSSPGSSRYVNTNQPALVGFQDRSEDPEAPFVPQEVSLTDPEAAGLLESLRHSRQFGLERERSPEPGRNRDQERTYEAFPDASRFRQESNVRGVSSSREGSSPNSRAGTPGRDLRGEWRG